MGMARQKRVDLLPFVADTATRATTAETVYDGAEEDSCIVIAHRANARSRHRALSLKEREQIEEDFKKLAEKLGRKVSK